ncbi:MAG: efflux transporter outer membrane subunit [Rubrivivax sp.]
MVEARASMLALAVLALAGCASAPAPLAPPGVALPAEAPFERAVATSPTSPQAIGRWWTLLDDAQLDARIAAALARNADLAVAAARLREARAQLDQASGAQWPQLDLSASSGRSRDQAPAGGSPADARRAVGGRHRVALVGEHEFDVWGRLAAGTQAARERLQAQQGARATIEWSLTAQVAEAHVTQRALQRQLDIARAVREGRQREVLLRRAQAEAGSGAQLDLRRAEAELAAAEATVASLSRRGLAVQRTLALLTGLPLDALVAAAHDGVQPLDPQRAFDTRLPQGPLAQLLTRRPDLRQAEAELMAARADVQAARAATLPRLRLSGIVGSDVRDLSSLFSAPGFAWSLASSVVQSVFDGGRARSRVHEAEARTDAALARYQRAVAAAVLDVREAYLAVEHDAQVLRAEQQRVAALAEALRLARVGWQAGVSTQLDTLDAERAHFQAQLAEVDAYRDRLLGQVAAFKSLGGGPAAAAPASDMPNAGEPS